MGDKTTTNTICTRGCLAGLRSLKTYGSLEKKSYSAYCRTLSPQWKVLFKLVGRLFSPQGLVLLDRKIFWGVTIELHQLRHLRERWILIVRATKMTRNWADPAIESNYILFLLDLDFWRSLFFSDSKPVHLSWNSTFTKF